MPSDSDCLFCKIVSADVAAAVVYQDESVLAFLDINPLAEGHLLVIPREHYREIAAMPADQVSRLFSPIGKLGRALIQVTGASGFNLLVNQGRAAGQVIDHVHCHLIPRKSEDGLGYRWNAKSYAKGKDLKIAAAYREAIGGTS